MTPPELEEVLRELGQKTEAGAALRKRVEDAMAVLREHVGAYRAHDEELTALRRKAYELFGEQMLPREPAGIDGYALATMERHLR